MFSIISEYLAKFFKDNIGRKSYGESLQLERGYQHSGLEFLLTQQLVLRFNFFGFWAIGSLNLANWQTPSTYLSTSCAIK
jgi:hypothetical protein